MDRLGSISASSVSFCVLPACACTMHGFVWFLNSMQKPALKVGTLLSVQNLGCRWSPAFSLGVWLPELPLSQAWHDPILSPLHPLGYQEVNALVLLLSMKVSPLPRHNREYLCFHIHLFLEMPSMFVHIIYFCKISPKFKQVLSSCCHLISSSKAKLKFYI